MHKSLKLLKLSNLPKLENKDEVFAIYEPLCKSLNHYAKVYYNTGEPLISDSEYDKLYSYLHTCEDMYSDVIKVYSPTQNVGSKQQRSENDYVHKTKMYSLGNVYDVEEFTIWYNTILTKCNLKSLPLSIEHKIDGLSVKLVYIQGELTHAALRGDGNVGADIVKYVKNIVGDIPSKLRTRPQENDAWASLRGIDIGVPEYIEITGELYIDPIDLPKINKVRISQKKQPYVTPRNAAAGLVNARTCEDLKFVAHGIGEYATADKISAAFTTTSQWMSGISDTFGFKTAVYSSLHQNCDKIEDIIASIRDIGEHRKDSVFPIDGAVIKVTDFNLINQLGHTRKIPKWAIAYKYPAEESTTILTDVMWTIGRTGTLTPVATFLPVTIGGVSIGKASLHNATRIKELDLCYGDIIFVVRSGDVIPEVTSVVKYERKKNAKQVAVPALCPCCKTAIVPDGNSSVKCPNSECKDRVKASLIYSCSKGLLNIAALGPSNIATLVDAGCMHGLYDVINLNVAKIDSLFPPVTDKKTSLAMTILKSIEKARSTWNMETCLCALNIPRLNRKAAGILAKHYGNFNSMFNSQEEEEVWIKLVGTATGESIKQHINDPSVYKSVAAFQSCKI